MDRDFFLVPLFLLLSLIMGFRAISVGVDTLNYYHTFMQISKMNFEDLLIGFTYDDAEIGYVIFIKLISMLFDDYFAFQIITSFLFCFFMIFFIRENAINYIISSVVFIALLYLLSFNISRQMLAVSMLAYGWCLYAKKKYKGAFLISLLSVSFHYSAVFFVVVYFVYYLRNNKFFVDLFPLLMLIFVILFDIVMSFVEKYFVYYSDYYGNTRDIQNANMSKYLWLLEFLMSLYIIYKNKVFDAYHKYIAMISMMSSVVNYISLSFNYFERIGLYLYPFLILLFDIFGLGFKNKYICSFYYFSVCVCFLFLFFKSTKATQYIYSFFF